MSFYLRNDAEPIEYEPGELLTEQHHAEKLDIDYIVDQFTRTGVLKHNDQYQATYGEFITGNQYELAQEKIAEANSMFETLPPDVRSDFADAGEFLDFITDENNREAIEDYGLTTDHLPPLEPNPDPTPTPTPTPAEPAPEPSPEPSEPTEE